MSNRVFIGNVSYDLTGSELESALAELGHAPAKVEIIMDRETGRSRGFGFAEYDSDDAAERAIYGLNGQYVGNRPIRVDRATALRKPEGGPPRGGRGAPGGGPPRHRDEKRGDGGRAKGERGWDEEWSGEGKKRRGRR